MGNAPKEHQNQVIQQVVHQVIAKMTPVVVKEATQEAKGKITDFFKPVTQETKGKITNFFKPITKEQYFKDIKNEPTKTLIKYIITFSKKTKNQILLLVKILMMKLKNLKIKIKPHLSNHYMQNMRGKMQNPILTHNT